MKTVANTNGNQKMKNKTVTRVFEDLEVYKAFCVEYGFRFNEADLYKRNTPYGQYERIRRGDPVRNNWDMDAAGFASVAEPVRPRQ
jgi:hypothetical protein